MQVEFLGIPRQRAGIAQTEIQAETLGQLLGALASEIPGFSELIAGDRLQASFVANLNGNRFVTEPQTALHESDHVLILSADAGG